MTMEELTPGSVARKSSSDVSTNCHDLVGVSCFGCLGGLMANIEAKAMVSKVADVL